MAIKSFIAMIFGQVIRHMVKKKPRRAVKSRRNSRRVSRRSKPAAESGPRISIDFCPKCGSILIPVKKGKSTSMKCRNCGYSSRRDVKSLKIFETVKKKKVVTVLEKDTTPLPMTEKMCPKCEHPRSYWWLQQTRSADEPPTQFFRCEKCKHTWREYK